MFGVMAKKNQLITTTTIINNDINTIYVIIIIVSSIHFTFYIFVVLHQRTHWWATKITRWQGSRISAGNWVGVHEQDPLPLCYLSFLRGKCLESSTVYCVIPGSLSNVCPKNNLLYLLLLVCLQRSRDFFKKKHFHCLNMDVLMVLSMLA